MKSPRVRLLVATSNRGKLREIATLLGSQYAIEGLTEHPEVALPPEGDDYAANAATKARCAALASGLPALAEDSGLEVEALGGAPGPHSARYGGDGLDDAGRVALLLRDLAARGARASRGARFVCVAALATADGRVETARGECAGRILAAPRGDGGFGYDPVFAPGTETRSFSELGEAEKHRVSHRARALAALAPVLAALRDPTPAT